VTSSTIVGGAARVLSSQPAQLVVVGTRELGRARSAIVGSVSLAACSRAVCPVVVVPQRRNVRPNLSPTRVVVGVDGSDLSQSAIGFALAAAAHRGMGLTALHAWIPRPSAGVEGLGDDWVATAAVERHRLAAALTPWRSRFPRTDIRLKVVPDEPARALASESPGAALLVVGSRGHGCMTGLLFGSVSHAVVRYARCPTAVVRPVTERSPAT
jgi:nucleotide-binding universal stress UspA family protein